MHRIQLTVIAATILLLTVLTIAQIPQEISFQGRLADVSGVPVSDGSYSVTFRIYTAETGGTAVWSETQIVATSNGLFSTMLGSVTPFGTSVDFTISLWLSVEVGGTELTPRYKLGASPYAFVSILADSAMYSMYAMYAQNAVDATYSDTADMAYSVAWGDISDMPAGFADGVDDEGTSGATYVAGDGIDIADTVISVADDGITTVKIADEAVTGVKIAQMSALSGQVLKWNGTIWTPENDETGSGGTGVNSITAGSGLTGGGTGDVTIAVDDGGIEWTHLSIAVQESIQAGGSAGDNWGTQVVQHDVTIIGDGTTGDELGIATSAVGWNNLTSAVQESIQASGAAGLTQVHHTSAFTGTGETIDPLDLADDAVTTSKIIDANVTPAKIDPTGGSAGQVLKIIAGSVQWANDEGGGAGLTQVYHSAEFTGTGESIDPLFLANSSIIADRLDLTDITVSDFTNDAGYLTLADLNDNDATNELITAFSWTDGINLLRITESGADWDVVIDNEADDLSDNNIGDLADVDVSILTDGDVLKWNSISSVWEPGTDLIDPSLWTDNGTSISPNNNSDVYIYDSGQNDGIIVDNATHYAGRFYYDSDNMATLGSSDGFGVFARGTMYAIRGYNPATGNYGQLGTPNYAGEFHGDVYVTDKVGIGTTSPDEELVVGTPLGGGWAIPAITVGDSSSGGGIEVGTPTYSISMSASSVFGRGRIISSDDGGYGKGDIEFKCNAVGIGTGTPDEILHIDNGASSAYVHLESDAYAFFQADGGSGNSGITFKNGGVSKGLIWWASTDNYLAFSSGDAGDPEMVIDTNGYVGIGTDTPEDPLYVKHTVTTHSYINSPTITGFVTDGADTMIGIIAGQNGFQGVYGWTNKSSGYGVRGEATGSSGHGVHGFASCTGSSYGVYGFANGTGSTNYGVYGRASGATTDWAGYFNGDVNITGSLSKGAGSFLIDHPLDPLNKT
ncbi:hypothetical protein J7L68_00315, partial [bacterium]|nr:hypothetical protein [bacterium]